MLGFAWAAACMPAHDDWLNDLSSTPPVSSTMHALNAVPEGAAVLPDPEPLSAGLLPHPASPSALATAHTPIVTPRDPAKAATPYQGLPRTSGDRTLTRWADRRVPGHRLSSDRCAIRVLYPGGDRRGLECAAHRRDRRRELGVCAVLPAARRRRRAVRRRAARRRLQR